MFPSWEVTDPLDDDPCVVDLDSNNSFSAEAGHLPQQQQTGASTVAALKESKPPLVRVFKADDEHGEKFKDSFYMELAVNLSTGKHVAWDPRFQVYPWETLSRPIETFVPNDHPMLHKPVDPAFSSSLRIIASLFERGCDPNLRDHRNRTPLQAWATFDDFELSDPCGPTFESALAVVRHGGDPWMRELYGKQRAIINVGNFRYSRIFIVYVLDEIEIYRQKKCFRACVSNVIFGNQYVKKHQRGVIETLL
jgi:hypothetical protein